MGIDIFLSLLYFFACSLGLALSKSRYASSGKSIRFSSISPFEKYSSFSFEFNFVILSKTPFAIPSISR